MTTATATAIKLDRGDATIAVRCDGSGPPLLLLHATLSPSRTLERLARLLANSHRVYRVDRRGSGDSREREPAGDGPIDAATHVADLVALDRRQRASVVLPSWVTAMAAAWRLSWPLVTRTWWPGPGSTSRHTRTSVPRRCAHDCSMSGATRPPWPRQVVQRPRPWRSSRVCRALMPRHRSVRPRATGSRERGAPPSPTRPCRALTLPVWHGSSVPSSVATGSNSDAFYDHIADALASRIPTAQRMNLDGLDHLRR